MLRAKRGWYGDLNLQWWYNIQEKRWWGWKTICSVPQYRVSDQLQADPSPRYIYPKGNK